MNNEGGRIVKLKTRIEIFIIFAVHLNRGSIQKLNGLPGHTVWNPHGFNNILMK